MLQSQPESTGSMDVFILVENVSEHFCNFSIIGWLCGPRQKWKRKNINEENLRLGSDDASYSAEAKGFGARKRVSTVPVFLGLKLSQTRTLGADSKSRFRYALHLLLDWKPFGKSASESLSWLTGKEDHITYRLDFRDLGMTCAENIIWNIVSACSLYMLSINPVTIQLHRSPGIISPPLGE